MVLRKTIYLQKNLKTSEAQKPKTLFETLRKMENLQPRSVCLFQIWHMSFLQASCRLGSVYIPAPSGSRHRAFSLVSFWIGFSYWSTQFCPATDRGLWLVDAKLKRRSFVNNSRRRSWLTGKGLGLLEIWFLQTHSGERMVKQGFWEMLVEFWVDKA